MSKLRKRLSKWFLDRAKKLDEETVLENTFVIPPASQPVIMYDEYHVEKIHAQHMLSRDIFMFNQNFNIDEYASNSIVRGVSEELMKLYGDKIKIEDIPDGKIYSLDVYVCKPQKKESL